MSRPLRFRRSRPPVEEERVLPLINVVFLLLIFFMLAGRLTASESARIEPPHSVSDGPPPPEAVVVAVTADGQLALNGTITAATELTAAVAARAGGGQAPVRLLADGRAEAARVVLVLELLRAAGVGELRLLTIREAQ